MLAPADFFDLSKTRYRDVFEQVDLVWNALTNLPNYLQANVRSLSQGSINSLAYVDENVCIGSGTVVEPGAVIKGPTIIGDNCEVRAGAYIRGNVLVGDRVIVGHATELKNCLIFNEAEIPHFSYVGDSILGWRTHLGAGAKISNLKVNRSPIILKIEDKQYHTGLIKLGAILADEVEIGCNCVLNPGTLMGKRTLAYANLSLRGYTPPNSIIKLYQSHEVVNRNR